MITSNRKYKYLLVLCAVAVVIICVLNAIQPTNYKHRKSLTLPKRLMPFSKKESIFDSMYDTGLAKNAKDENVRKMPHMLPLLVGNVEQAIIEERMTNENAPDTTQKSPVKHELVLPQMARRKNDELSKEALLKVKVQNPKQIPAPNAAKSDPFMGKVVYNRVGKCGSRSMLTIINRLAVRNRFLFYSSRISNLTRPNALQVKQVGKIVYDLPTPSLYSRHIHYVDFTKYGMVQPVYINMIRDPIERFSSQYHFKRFGDEIKSGIRINGGLENEIMSMDINDCVLKNHPECTDHGMGYIIAYFCGQLPMCNKGNIEALEMAKENLMKNYLVVGYLEDFEGMLKVTETLLPEFFKGALDAWQLVQNHTVQHTATSNKTELSTEAYKVLRNRLKLEYMFYDYAKSIFIDLKKRLGIV